MTITSNIKTQQGVSNLKDAGKNFADAAESNAKDYTSDLANTANQLGQRVGDAARSAVNAAETYAKNAAEKAGEYTGRVNEFGHGVEDQIRTRPVQATFIALATGLVLGMLLRK